MEDRRKCSQSFASEIRQHRLENEFAFTSVRLAAATLKSGAAEIDFGLRFRQTKTTVKSGLELELVGLKSKCEEARWGIRIACLLLVSCSRPRFLQPSRRWRS